MCIFMHKTNKTANAKCKQVFTLNQLFSLLLILQDLPQIGFIRDELVKLVVGGRQVKHGGHLEKWELIVQNL